MKKYQEGKNSDLERSYNGRHNIDMESLSASSLQSGLRQGELKRASIPELSCLLYGAKEVHLDLEIRI